MRKKLIATTILSAFLCTFSPAPAALAADNVQTAYASEDILAFLPELQRYYYQNNELIAVDEDTPWQTENYQGHVYFPVRTISELFGFQVQWEAESQCVTLNNSEQTIALTVGNNTVLCNQAAQTIAIAPRLSEGRVLLPIRTIAQLTDKEVLYLDGVIYLSGQPLSTELPKTSYFQKIRLALCASNGIPTNPIITGSKPMNTMQDTLGTLQQYTYFLKSSDAQYDDLYRKNNHMEQTQLLCTKFWDKTYDYNRNYMLESAELYLYQNKPYLAVQRGSVNLGSYELFQINEDSLTLINYLGHSFCPEFFYQNDMYYLSYGSIGGQMPGLFICHLDAPQSDLKVLANELLIQHAYQEQQYVYVLAQEVAEQQSPQVYQINLETGERNLYMRIQYTN